MTPESAAADRRLRTDAHPARFLEADAWQDPLLPGGKDERVLLTLPRMERAPLAYRDPLLQAKDLGYRYGAFQVLRGVSRQVAPVELLALVGRNGAGKSTLLRCLAGWYQVEEGTVERGGGKEEGPTVVVVPDTPAFYAELTVIEPLQFIAQLHGHRLGARRVAAPQSHGPRGS